jgi:hypothetical protein
MTDWQDIGTAPCDRRVLVNFRGAGPIVAYRDVARPEQWVRYIGFGKSAYWPSIHEDFALHWMPVPPPPNQEGESA